MDGKQPQKSNFLTPQRQPYFPPSGMFPPRPFHSTLNLDLLDSMFQKLQMSSKVFKSNKIEDKVQLQDTFQPKVIKFNSGQEIFMGFRVNRSLPSSQILKSSSKQNSQNQTAPKPNIQNSNTTTIKIPKMNIFKTIPIAEAISPPVEDKKKCIIII